MRKTTELFLSIGLSVALHVLGVYLILHSPMTLERLFRDETSSVLASEEDKEETFEIAPIDTSLLFTQVGEVAMAVPDPLPAPAIHILIGEDPVLGVAPPPVFSFSPAPVRYPEIILNKPVARDSIDISPWQGTSDLQKTEKEVFEDPFSWHIPVVALFQKEPPLGAHWIPHLETIHSASASQRAPTIPPTVEDTYRTLAPFAITPLPLACAVKDLPEQASIIPDLSYGFPVSYNGLDPIERDASAALHMPTQNFSPPLAFAYQPPRAPATSAPLPSSFADIASFSPATTVERFLDKKAVFSPRRCLNIPTLLELDTLSLQDAFDCAVTVSPKRMDGHYFFSVTLTPKHPEEIPPITQNYTFLIDKSGGVDKGRFRSYREAVLKALGYLKEGDTFNILTFDSGVTKLSQHSLYYSDAALRTAKEFLQGQEKSSGSADLFHLLAQMGEIAKRSVKHNTIILLTNGSTLSLGSERTAPLKEFFLDYQGEYSLFLASASQGNNDALLELLGKIRKGEYLHTPTYAAFPRRVSAMVKKMQKMIAKHMRATPVNIPSDTDVQLFPEAHYLPDLYADRPFTLFGIADALTDFDLIFQGRAESTWFNIRKKISLAQAEAGDRTIDKEYAFYRSLKSYEQYLAEGVPFYLEEAAKGMSLRGLAP